MCRLFIIQGSDLMTIYKNKDITTNIESEKLSINNSNTSFYTEDKGSAALRIFIKYRDGAFNLNDTNLTPTLDLFHNDGSIWCDEPLEVIMSDKGLLQYNIPDNVIAHAGLIKAKLFLRNTEQSVHVSNFTFDIKDSGITGAIGKEIHLDILDDTVKKVILDNQKLFKGEDANPEDVKKLLEPYADKKAKEESEKLSVAKQQDAEVIQARNGMSSLSSRLDEADKKINNTQRVINVKSLGAKGNGKTDDYQIIQDAIYEAERTNSNVYIPSGTYYVSQTLRTAHKTTPHYTTGIRIFGDGKTSVLKGNGASAVDYNDLTKTSKGALIALHGGNNIVENLELTQCTVGI